MIARLAGRTLLGILAVAIAMSLARAHAADAPPTPAGGLSISGLTAGFAGKFKIGSWTRFEVELTAGAAPVAGRVKMIVLDGDGVPSRVHAPAEGDLKLAAGESRTIALDSKIGQLASDVTVDFRGASGVLASRTFTTRVEGPLAGALASQQTLIVALGDGMSKADEEKLATRGLQVARVANLADLPTDWWGYEGVNALVISPSAAAGTPSGEQPQLAAIETWVRMGGRVIIALGRNAETLLAAPGPLARLTPGRFESLQPLKAAALLEAYVETVDPLASPELPFELQVPKLAEVRGRIESFAGNQPSDLPLVVRSAYGLGEVVFAAFDLGEANLVRWAARPQLFDKLLKRVATESQQTDDTLGEVTTLGFVDLAGQLRGALDQFPGVRLVPFWLVAVLATAYILCIGPLDYYLVKRVFKRMDATWLTFALWVVIFCAGAWVLAHQLKGRQMRTNQVDLVDFDAETNLVRGTTWANVFSPEFAAYDLALEPSGVAGAAKGQGMLLSWFGLSGLGFGGMDTAGAIGGSEAGWRSLPLFTEPYDFSARLDRLERVPIAIWSSKAFLGRWWHEAPPPITARLVDKGRLSGTLQVGLDVPLEDSVLIYDKWAYLLQKVSPGATISMDRIDPQTVLTFLRRVRAQGDQQVSPPYDRQSFDIPRIVEMMTAHELAGGRRYTGLDNTFGGFAELSTLVRNGRAVLVGRVPRPAARLIAQRPSPEKDPSPEAETQNWTFYRFVFPVDNSADSVQSRSSE